MDKIALIHVHQDQVTSLPDGARRIASADHCKNAAFVIGDDVFAIQGHPEFDADYTDSLSNLLVDRAGADCVNQGRQSLATPHDGKLVASWILAFFCQTCANGIIAFSGDWRNLLSCTKPKGIIACHL